MRNHLSKPLAVLALVAGLSFVSSPAGAATSYPDFTVNQAPISNCLAAGTGCVFVADAIQGGYTELLTITSFNPATNMGSFSTVAYWNANAFYRNENTQAIIFPPSMLNLQGAGIDGYDIYSLFGATGNFFPNGAGGFNFSATGGCANLYVDLNVDSQTPAFPATVTSTSCTPAIPPGASMGITFGAAGADDLLLASSPLAFGEGHQFPGQANGDFALIFQPFTLTALGASVFTNPVPFYITALLEGNFNNFTPLQTNQTITGTATLSFPEPASLALFGIGLLGSSMAVRRRKKAAQK